MRPTITVCAHIVDLDLSAAMGQLCASEGWAIALWDSRGDTALPLEQVTRPVDIVLFDDAAQLDHLQANSAPDTVLIFLGDELEHARVLSIAPDLPRDEMLRAITNRLNVRRFHRQFFEEGAAEPITRLPHHTELMQAIEKFRGRPMGLLVIQVDHAQHLYGNLDPVSKTDLLGALGDFIETHLPRNTLMGIYDAASFSVWYPALEKQEIHLLAHRLCEAARRPLQFKSGQLHFTFSIGYGFQTVLGEPRLLWQHAWQRKEQARALGGDQAFSNREEALDQRIPEALSRDEFSLALQPQWSIDGRKLTGVESLLRWQGVEVGNISPDRFIPIAERSGQMARVGDWVLERASCESATWLEHLLSPLYLGINISPQQFTKAAIKEQIERLAHDKWLDPSILELELELSHSNLLHVVDRHRATLYELRDAGVRIAIDNLGIDLVDTEKLLRCPADTLKIDRTLVSALEHDDEAKALVEQICKIGDRFRLRTVAVGVENANQRTFLDECGCTDAQGFLFSEPVPLESFQGFLLEHALEDESETEHSNAS